MKEARLRETNTMYFLSYVESKTKDMKIGEVIKEKDEDKQEGGK
jgi:hypothetical protein